MAAFKGCMTGIEIIDDNGDKRYVTVSWPAEGIWPLVLMNHGKSTFAAHECAVRQERRGPGAN